MKYLLPRFGFRLLPRMLGVAFLGAVIAGCYGALHDQITYSISAEYFTRMKFDQFRHADFGLPARVFVAEIGFLATWWVGLIAGWIFARIAIPAWEPREALRKIAIAFAIMISVAMMAAITGYLLGMQHSADYSYWQATCSYLHVLDTPAFVTVALIHNASYVGGLIGMVAAIPVLYRQKRAALPGGAALLG